MNCNQTTYLKICAFISLALLLPTNAFAQDKCDNALQEASGKIGRAHFDEAIQLLLDCQPKLEQLSEKLEGLRLLGRAYVGSNYLEDARRTIHKLLELSPDWEPDRDRNPPQFLQIVDIVKQQKLEEANARKNESKGGKKKWFLIIGGGAAAAVLTVALISGGGGEKRLPGPPQFP